jgi:uncharacterized membrane protein
MIPRLTMRMVLEEGGSAGLLPPDIEPVAQAALASASQNEMPWYLRLLMGGAAWVGALFMLSTVLGLVSLALGERVDLAALVLGLLLIPAGVRMRAARGEFVRQASLVCVITGQLLLLGAIGSLSDSVAVTSIATIVSTAVLIVAYDEAVYRFGGTLAVIGAVLVLAFERKVPYGMGLITAATACVPVAVWRVWPGPSGVTIPGWSQPLHRLLDPVAWACAVTACSLLAVQAAIEAVTGTAGYAPGFISLLLPRPWPLTSVMVVLLVWTAVQVARDHGSELTDPTPLAAIAGSIAIGLLTLSTPAVCGALMLVVLGFDRRRAGLVGLAASFLVGFLGLYYYSLALSLLQKSAVLVASGALCLVAAAFFRSQSSEVES